MGWKEQLRDLILNYPNSEDSFYAIKKIATYNLEIGRCTPGRAKKSWKYFPEEGDLGDGSGGGVGQYLFHCRPWKGIIQKSKTKHIV